MNTRFFVVGFTLGLVCAVGAHAQSAAQVCEAAVAKAIEHSRGVQAKQVQFGLAKRAGAAQPPASTASAPVFDASVQGQGHYAGPRGNVPFSYRCTMDAQTQEATGVIFQDAVQLEHAPEKPWQADLTNLSPEVCEAAVAAAVVQKYPRAVNVGLSSQSRQLKPAPNGHTYLLGQGNLQRAAGMAAAGFTYRCELDTSSGKLLGVQTDPLP